MRLFRKRYMTISAWGLFGFFGFLMATGAVQESSAERLSGYDNQGSKIYEAYDHKTQADMTSASGGRNLADFYALRQYPGSPPRIPHEVDQSFSAGDQDCLSCHEKGGYSSEFEAFTPVTPHPENTLCYQCHTPVPAEDGYFVESSWKSIESPRLGRSSLGGSPPPVPHSLQLRENCIACHTGPAAVAEIRVSHAARGDCRQCHATVVQTAPLKLFERK